MNTVNYITPSDGDIYLVNNQTYVNSGGTDFDKIYNNILKVVFCLTFDCG